MSALYLSIIAAYWNWTGCNMYCTLWNHPNNSHVNETLLLEFLQVGGCAWMPRRGVNGLDCGDPSLYCYSCNKESIHALQGLATVATWSNNPRGSIPWKSLRASCRFGNPSVATCCHWEHTIGYFLKFLHRLVWIDCHISGQFQLQSVLIFILDEPHNLSLALRHFLGLKA